MAASGDVTLAFDELTAKERYKLLIGLVIPRPIAWISTWSPGGVANCAPFSFFNVVCEDPALICVGFGRRQDHERKHTLMNIERTGEFVVNLPDEATANAMHRSAAELPESESEFARFGLTPVPGTRVAHPRILEAPVSFECKVYETVPLGERAVVLGEILMVHARAGVILDSGRASEESFQPIGRLFGNRYCTTRQRFDLPGDLPA